MNKSKKPYPVEALKQLPQEHQELIRDHVQDRANVSNAIINALLKQPNNTKTAQQISDEMEVAEEFESMMGWEEKTLKIDSTGWKEKTQQNHDWNKNFKIKVSPKWDVLEHLDDSLKGKQIITWWTNFLKYIAQAKGISPKQAEKKYLMEVGKFQDNMRKIEQSEWGYKAFYEKEIAWNLSWSWDTVLKKLSNPEIDFHVWLADRYTAQFSEDWRDVFENDDNTFSASARLLKEPK